MHTEESNIRTLFRNLYADSCDLLTSTQHVNVANIIYFCAGYHGDAGHCVI